MKKLLLGIVQGISYAVPGLCSASMSIILGIYEDIIEIFSCFYKTKIIKKHIFLIIGIVIGIIIWVFLFSSLLDKYLIYLNSIFIGFIIGGLKFENIFRKKKITNIVAFLFGILIVVLTNLIGKIPLSNFNINYSFIMIYIIIFFVAMISSIALILPGISGALILYVFGLYDRIVKSVKLIINSILNFHTLIGENLLFLLVFSIGFLIGLLWFSKIIDKFIKGKKSWFSTLTNGFVVGSIIILMYDLVINIKSYCVILPCIVMIIIGYLVSKVLIKSNE